MKKAKYIHFGIGMVCLGLTLCNGVLYTLPDFLDGLLLGLAIVFMLFGLFGKSEDNTKAKSKSKSKAKKK